MFYHHLHILQSNIVYMSISLCYFISIISLNDFRQVPLAGTGGRMTSLICNFFESKTANSLCDKQMTGEDSDLLGSDAMLAGVYRRFGRVCHLQLQGLAVSQTLLTIYQSARHHIPQEWNLRQYCCENLKSRTSGQFIFIDKIMCVLSAEAANVLMQPEERNIVVRI